MSSAQDHRWTFLATSAEPQAPGLLAAVCDRCGAMRTGALPKPGYERHINIIGTCPGAPQQSERPGGARKLDGRDN
ncbi:MAG TPA: hypothetical protein VGI98_01015 [Candidatus Limnocylindrales bacterium]|jgi:hypothetical protein